MAVQVTIKLEDGTLLDSFLVMPRTPSEEPLDTAHAIRDLISTVTEVTDNMETEA